MLSDLLFAVRSLRRSPVFTVVAIASLALGIGANTAIFSFVNAILLKHLPVPHPERLVTVVETNRPQEVSTADSSTFTVYSYPFIQAMNRQTELFDGLAGTYPVRVSLARDQGSAVLHGEIVTGAYFHVLQIKAAAGRLLTEADINSSVGDPVCVLSYRAWQTQFAGDPQIVGRRLRLNAHAYRVIGVTERSFYGSQIGSRFDMQLPVSRMGDFMGGFFGGGQGGLTFRSPGFSWLQPIGRLRHNLSRKRASAVLQSLAPNIRRELADPKNRAQPDKSSTSFALRDASQGTNPDRSRRTPLLVLMGIVSLIILIACLNLANLLLVKAKNREKEFALRLSLGAGRWRIARQLLCESFLLALVGGALGVLLSSWLTETLLFYLNASSMAGEGMQIAADPVVLLFAAALSFTTALLFGLAPALHSTSVDILSRLKEAQFNQSGGRDKAYTRKLFTVVQISLAVCLLFGSGLLTATLSNLQTVDLGFQPARVVALSIDPAMAGYRGNQVEHTFDRLVQRLRSVRGVTAASYAVVTPLDGAVLSMDFSVPGYTPSNSSDREVNFNAISPGYFNTLHQPFLAGRDFSMHDSKAAPRVAIVNQAFVKQYMRGQNPVGRHFKTGSSDMQIAGVVADAHYRSLREIPGPVLYLPIAQSQSSGYGLLVRVRGDPKQLIPQIQSVIRSVDNRLPIYNVRTLQQQIDQGISSERILGLLSQLFAGLATLLCVIGLYGVIAYGVTLRTREVGIRLAIGATRMSIARLFFREGILLLAIGVSIGIPLALAGARTLNSLMYGVKNDSMTLLLMVGILLLAGLLAIALPTQRAATVEPSAALRHE